MTLLQLTLLSSVFSHILFIYTIFSIFLFCLVNLVWLISPRQFCFTKWALATGRLPRSWQRGKEGIKRVCSRGWAGINQDYLSSELMPRRMKAVINMGGGVLEAYMQ